MVRRICEITVTLDFIFWLVLYRSDDVLFIDYWIKTSFTCFIQ